MAIATADYASVFSKKVDERFYEESHIAAALNNDYKFTGVKTVNVYTIPTSQMNDYDRTGAKDSSSAFHRYGTPANLDVTKQSLTITKDRSFSFIIDKADKEQTRMVLDAGKALSRQMREVVVPEYDKYCLLTLAQNAGADNKSSTAVTDSNAYDLFLSAQEALSDASVPESGRVCFASYKYANLLAKLDTGFIKSGDLSQRRLISGEMGTVDGVRIIRIPKTWMPSKAASGATTYADFIITHPIAATAPKQLEEYRIHDNPPGISGWLVEGRILYDCFVLNNKKAAIFYQGPAL